MVGVSASRPGNESLLQQRRAKTFFKKDMKLCGSVTGAGGSTLGKTGRSNWSKTVTATKSHHFDDKRWTRREGGGGSGSSRERARHVHVEIPALRHEVIYDRRWTHGNRHVCRHAFTVAAGSVK